MAGSAGSGRETRGSTTSPGLTTLRLTVEYDGTAFCGFQFQPNQRTIAGELESVLSRLFAEPVKITAAGRTDAGVHASGQVVSLTTARSSFPFQRLSVALNSALPCDISVRDAAIVPPTFSARFSALERTYVYAILNRTQPSALLRRLAYHVWAPIDLERFGEAAAPLIGKHDFRSFCATGPASGNTVRTISSLTILRCAELIRVQISADGFLHRMVRAIVGALIGCATGNGHPSTMGALIAARTRSGAGLTAPGHGLYLAGIRYRDGYDSYAEPPVFQLG